MGNAEGLMDFIAFIVFVMIQIIFIPLAVIGLILLTVKQLIVSNRDLFCNMFQWNSSFNVHVICKDGSFRSLHP